MSVIRSIFSSGARRVSTNSELRGRLGNRFPCRRAQYQGQSQLALGDPTRYYKSALYGPKKLR